MIVWAFETLLASTILMLLVLAIRKPVRRAFGPTIAYALWALPLLRMLMPPLPADWREAAPAPLAAASEIIVYHVAEPLGIASSEAAAAGTGTTIGVWLLALWVIGSIGFIGYHLVAHDRFTRRVRRLARSIRRVANGKVEVIETDAATGPLAFGVLRKYVAFPRDFAERYDPLERDLALAHELGHHARGDLIANWAALVVLGVHWFNPVAWRAYRAFRADQELACDALVLAGRAAGLRHAYGRAIVKSAHGGAVSAACHLHTINELKGRLKMLNLHEKKSRTRLLAGAGALGALTLGSLGITASGTHAAERVRTSVETAVGIDLAGIQEAALNDPLPPPPAPPAVAPTAPAPPAPVAALDAKDAPKTKSRIRIVTRDKDGKLSERVIDSDDREIVLDGAGAPHGVRHRFVFSGKDGKPGMPDLKSLERLSALRTTPRNLPRIISRDCKSGEGGRSQMTFESGDGKTRSFVICTNRIEMQASRAAEASAAAQVAAIDLIRIERDAIGSARSGLRAARASIENNRSMSDSQRSAALSGIDEAIRELDSKPND